MTARKKTISRKVQKLTLKKRTIKDLDAKTKAESVKAGRAALTNSCGNCLSKGGAC